MITKVTLANVASFVDATTLKTDKKVNLVYGLTGAGKSTISNYFYDRDSENFSECSIEGLSEESVVVYNQMFIKDYFFEDGKLKGIFSLSKKNKEAEKKILEVQKIINDLKDKKILIERKVKAIDQDASFKKQKAMNKVWEIKTSYSGGDRVLEYCLEGLMGNKEKLFEHILNIDKPEEKSSKTIEKLKQDVQFVSGDDATICDFLEKISFSGAFVESNNLFKKAIVGNENSAVTKLIKSFNNSDWVKQGLSYLPDRVTEKTETCPFCQQKTITSDLQSDIKNYFDEVYLKDIEKLQELLMEYRNAIKAIPEKKGYTNHPFLKDKKTEFEKKYDNLKNLLNSNVKEIENKMQMPSQIVNLRGSQDVLKNLGDFIDSVNKGIKEFNTKVQEKDKTLNEIKNVFWAIMRWEYDQTILPYLDGKKDCAKKKVLLENKLNELNEKIGKNDETIRKQQSNTVNIETAIKNIKNALLNLGLDGFAIEKVENSKHLYRIVRNGSDESEVFRTLSEGEKMLISFLYFIEICKGKESASETHRKKIVVIDDPISSLSHVYVFNIAQMIQSYFTDPEIFKESDCKIEQVFILTHSLYFYYELTDIDKERRDENQKLFRIVKESTGSKIHDLKYENIRNDYHSYWSIVNNQNQQPALIANCMRNIVEYFFGFVEKRNFRDIFDKQTLKENKYQAFYRYMNRESHSFGQNVFDYKEFDYSNFKDALKLVFEKNGYEDHYKKMSKL